jgi:hypothetical protein
MERHEILEAMSELKLYGMRASFDEIAGKGLARRDEIYPLIASLIRAERTHRQARSISYRDRASAELRRSSCHRYRERATDKRIAPAHRRPNPAHDRPNGSAGAADGYVRSAPGH